MTAKFSLLITLDMNILTLFTILAFSNLKIFTHLAWFFNLLSLQRFFLCSWRISFRIRLFYFLIPFIFLIIIFFIVIFFIIVIIIFLIIIILTGNIFFLFRILSFPCLLRCWLFLLLLVSKVDGFLEILSRFCSFWTLFLLWLVRWRKTLGFARYSLIWGFTNLWLQRLWMWFWFLHIDLLHCLSKSLI